MDKFFTQKLKNSWSDEPKTPNVNLKIIALPWYQANHFFTLKTEQFDVKKQTFEEFGQFFYIKTEQFDVKKQTFEEFGQFFYTKTENAWSDEAKLP